MNIDEMQAGREMDREVAEKVMGDLFNPDFGWALSKYRHAPAESVCEISMKPPTYSISISAAWEVVEKVTNDFTRDLGFKFHVHSGGLTSISVDGDAVNYRVEGETAPLAICRAALVAAEKGYLGQTGRYRA